MKPKLEPIVVITCQIDTIQHQYNAIHSTHHHRRHLLYLHDDDDDGILTFL